MNDVHLMLTLEGKSSQLGHVTLSDFIKQLQHLQSALAKIDRSLSPTRQPSTAFRIVNLSHSSPARVVLGATAKPGRPDRRSAVVATLFACLFQIGATANGLDAIDPEVLQDLKAMSEAVRLRMRTVELATEELTFGFTETVHQNLESLLRTTTVGTGSVRGRLDAINLHAGANVFRIYPKIGARSINCLFPSHLSLQAKQALGGSVEVRGTLKYRLRQPFPHEVEVTSIVPLDEAPTVSWKDLRGVCPNLTGGLSSEDWIRQRRKELDAQLEPLLFLGAGLE